MPRPSVLSRRNAYLNKSDFGHVLVVAGSPSMLGAAALASLAAMRSGAGMVTAAVARRLNQTLQEKISHVVMTLPLPQCADGSLSLKALSLLQHKFIKYNACALGCGLGLNPSTIKLVHRLIKEYTGPMVVDADALNALSLKPEILFKKNGARILTPHHGEMARLMKVTLEEVKRDAKKLALCCAQRYDVVVLLKGHRTIVATPSGECYINRSGNVGMASAGSGDVLTGVIAALLAQGLSPFKAACLGAYMHGKAADKALAGQSKRSLIATDIIDKLGSIRIPSGY